MTMTVEQQIDQAVEDLKSILCQSAKSRQEAQRISDILDSIGYQLKSANSTLTLYYQFSQRLLICLTNIPKRKPFVLLFISPAITTGAVSIIRMY